MAREMLELEIDKLKKVVEHHEEQAKDLRKDLVNAERKLVDLDKPKLTNNQFSELHDLIETGISNFDFEYTGDYEIDLAMCDNTVEVERVEFNNKDGLAEEITLQVEKLFGIADENDNTGSSECSV